MIGAMGDPAHNLVWINGPFGVGKTTTAAALCEQTGWRTFDPEHVGYLLAANLRDIGVDDFQDLPPWRTLVPIVAAEINRLTSPSGIVSVQTVLVKQYWDELQAGMTAQGMSVLHVVLDCEEGELRRRITTDEAENQAVDWRLDHIVAFEKARRWLAPAADLVVDTTNLSPEEVARAIVDGFDHAGVSSR